VNAIDVQGSCTVIRTHIPLSDGERLHVTLFLPEAQDSASPTPVPAILEALPYRKDDMTAGWRPEYERFATEFGFAVARIDVRGTGTSSGRATDEYPEAEQRDLTEAIAWLAAQPWCNGQVGMFGTSYGGFNSLQLASSTQNSGSLTETSHMKQWCGASEAGDYLMGLLI